MNKLNGEDLAYIASHREAIYREWRTQIYFSFDSVKSGEKAMGILKRVYSDQINYEHYGIDKRDFYLGFNSSQVANDVCREINDSISEYYAVRPENVNYVAPAVADETIEGESLAGVGKSGNTTTYIIIGAAVMVIVLLLWNRKKKK